MASAKCLVVLLIAICFTLSFASDSFDSEHVAHLTTSSYEEKINDGKVYFIKFYAPWCGHCKRLAPTWSELGESLKDNEDVVIAHVDCTQDKEVCSSADVKGYPTLKLLHKGEEYKAYKGSRDLTALKQFVLDAQRDLLTEA